MKLRNLTLEQLIRLTMAAQILVATSLLSMGERNWWLTLATAVMLGVSAYVTDHQQRFRLKQPMADFAALCIVSFSLVYALRTDRQGILVAVANLQSYLQYVLMFQPKTARVYWQLAMLSLGQMAIGSTLVPGPAFGVLLVAYLLAGLITFSLLLLQQESTATTGDLDAIQGPDDEQRFAVEGHSKSSLVFKPVAASTTGLLLVGSAAPIDSVTLLRRLARAALMISAVSLTMAATLFFSLPRWTVPNIESDADAPLRTVGFSKTVTLGELGEVVQNSDVVMRIQFFRGRSSRPMKLEGEPLFRGTVVSRYSDRVWSQASRSSAVAMTNDSGSTMVRQRITTQPLDVPELFCIFPVHAIDEADSRLRVDTYSGQLFRHQDYQSQTIDIEVGTTGISGNKQRTVLPCDFQMQPFMRQRMLQIPEASEGPEEDADLFPGLRQMALRILNERAIDPETDRVAAARALSDYFHTSGQFFYSLDPQTRDSKLDPLEDFVTLHRAGHCEYFAGALTLMLRSVDIPARMAIGFKGGEWNPLGMYYQVQQLHAHAWVEVYLEEDQIPEGTFEGEEQPPAAWLVLDPTEGTQEIGADAKTRGFFTRINQSLDYARVLWNNYVVGLNPKVQRQGIYEPLAAGLEAAADNLTSAQRWQARLTALEESRLAPFWQWYRRHWFSWRGGLVAVAFSLAVSGLYLLARYVLRKLFGRWLGTATRSDAPPVLEMYRRLESVLAQQGLARQPSQTAFEFAIVAGGELAGHAQHRRVAHLPRRIVELFYRVRFGGRTLDNQEAEAVEHALAELELTLAAPP